MTLAFWFFLLVCTGCKIEPAIFDAATAQTYIIHIQETDNEN